MKKLDNVDLTDEAVKFAGEYISTKFKNGAVIEKHMVLNTVAHGYYMGAIESSKAPSWWQVSFWISKTITDEWVTTESIKAATFYLKKKKFKRLGFAQQALIKASLCYGFQHGYRSRQKAIGATLNPSV